MKALIVIAHGSRKQSSTDEIAQLTQSIRQLDHDFEWVAHSFLELTEPKVPQVIDQAIEQGAKDITLLPYFLAKGFHVANDLPQLLQHAREQHPQINIQLLEHFGSSPLMAQWIMQYVGTH